MRTTLLVSIATTTIVITAFAGPTAAQEPTSGEILVHTHSGPGMPAEPTVRLFRNGGTTDLWATYCGPSADPGYTSCDGLPEGTYTFGVADAPAGATVTPSCTFQSVNGEFSPVNVGSPTAHPTGVWNWDWNCELFVGRPGVVVYPATDQFPVPTAAIAGGSATCSTSELHEGSTVTWCTAPAPGEWTIDPPAEAAGWTVTSRCEPIGTYLVAGYPLETLTFTNSIDDPLWRCQLEYRQDALIWFVVAEPGSPEAAYADAPWQVLDAETGEDVSARCSESDPGELGAIVAYRCDVPTGRYSVVIEGFDPPYGVSACTDVYVQDVTYCSALEVLPTSVSYLISTWAAPGETWPDAVTIELRGGPADAPAPECRTITDDVFTRTETAVNRERWGECVRILPGTYSFVVSGAPAGATIEIGECEDFVVIAGGSWQCSVSIRTVEPPPDPDQPAEEPLAPGATLPPTGPATGHGIALGGVIAALLGVGLLALTRRRLGAATERGGARGR